MPGLTPTRTEISDRFSVLGFRVHTGRNPYFEVAIATDPSLFHADAQARRTPENFFSSRSSGPLAAERGETVYFVPPSVLRRFAGNERIYYTMAAFADTARSNPDISDVPDQARPWVTLSKSFTGREIRRLIGTPSRRPNVSGLDGYQATSPDSFSWAGDAVVPGASQAVEPAKDGASAATKAAVSAQPAAPKGAPVGIAGSKSSEAPAAATAVAQEDFEYDDGYSPELWARQQGASAVGEVDENAEGINEPIPDQDSGQLAAAQEEAAPSGISPEYPNATRFSPAASVNYSPRSAPRTIEKVVIHITDGQSKINGTIGWFQNPNQKNSKNKTIHTSAHYVVGQDGEVVQMVRNQDVAYHANAANPGSIGIEHVARAPHEFNKTDPGLYPTDAQYCASAALVNWLCNQFNLPMDRDHIMGHSEADPKTTHTDCPNAVWDWDYFMPLVTSATCTPRTASSETQAYSYGETAARDKHRQQRGRGVTTRRVATLEADQSFDVNWNDVELVAQPTGVSCWAAAAAMVVGWRDQICITPDTIASLFGANTHQALYPRDHKALADALGLVAEPPQSYLVAAFRRMLEAKGPLWVGIRTDDGWNHAVVVTGLYGDGSPDGTFVRVNDPWGRAPGAPTTPGSHNPTPGRGSRYTLTFQEFAKEYEERATSDGSTVNIQIMDAGDTQGRQIGTGAQAQKSSYSLSQAAPPKKDKRQSVGKALQAAVVVPIATTIAGAVLTRVLNNEGDIKWELDQMKGLKHPRDNAASAGNAPFSDGKINITGPVVENYLTDQIYANFELLWQYNGRSLGNITISDTQTNDAVGWGLTVKANINDDAKLYPVSGGSGECAGVQVRFWFRFDRVIGSDQIYIMDLSLHGDGTFTSSGQWTQQ